MKPRFLKHGCLGISLCALCGLFLANYHRGATSDGNVEPVEIPVEVIGRPIRGYHGWNAARAQEPFPECISKDEIQQIYDRLGELDGITQHVFNVDVSWQDIPVALRIRVPRALIFCAKDQTNRWQVIKVFHVRD